MVEKYGTQLQFELTYAEDLSTFEPLVPYMQQQWQVIGAEMRMSPLLFPELLDTIHDNDDYDLALLVLSWLADRDRKVMLAWNKYDGGLNSTRSGNRC